METVAALWLLLPIAAIWSLFMFLRGNYLPSVAGALWKSLLGTFSGLTAVVAFTFPGAIEVFPLPCRAVP